MGSWPIQLARQVQDHGCCWHHGSLSPDDLSVPISAQWERDPVILHAISKWHVKPGFVRKQNVAPLPASPALMNPGPLASCFTVSQRQQNANVGTARFQSSLFLTLLSQTLVPGAFLSNQPNFQLERNLLRQDEAVIKRSSSGGVLRGLPDLGKSVTFPVYWNLFNSRLNVNCGVGNAQQRLMPTCQR